MTVPPRPPAGPFAQLFINARARFAHHRGRALLSAAGIALGVALGFAVHLINGAALNEFSLAVRSMAGDADLEVRGGRSGFPEALYPALAKIPGVAVASPMLDLEVGLAGDPGAARAGGRSTLRVLGIDALRAVQVQPGLFADDPRRLFELMKPDMVLLSPSAAAALKLAQGDKLALLFGSTRVELEVAGIVPGLRGSAALTDIATAQWRFGRIGALNRIDLRFEVLTGIQSVDTAQPQSQSLKQNQ